MARTNPLCPELVGEQKKKRRRRKKKKKKEETSNKMKPNRVGQKFVK